MTTYKITFSPVDCKKFTAELPETIYLDSKYMVQEILEDHIYQNKVSLTEAYEFEVEEIEI